MLGARRDPRRRGVAARAPKDSHAAVLAQRCVTVLLLLLAGAVLALGAAWPFTGFSSTYGRWLGWPYASMVALVCLYLAAAVRGSGRRRWLWQLAASACLGVIWSSFRVLSMGDSHWWRKATADGTVSYAEPLSSLAHGLVFSSLGAGALEWMAPVVGFIATFVWLRVSDRLFVRAEGPAAVFARFVAALLWVSSGICAVFFHRYVEHSQIGVPLLVLGLANLTTWSRNVASATGGADVRSGHLFAGMAQLAIAALSHLQYAGMLAAGLGSALLVGSRLGLRRVARDMALLLAMVAGLIGATFAVLKASPFRVVTGSVAGGGDGVWLVPLVGGGGSWFEPGALLSASHLASVARTIVFACPLALPFALAVPWCLRRGADPSRDLVLAGTALAYVLFVSLYSFDLGWPNDLDLMVAMSPSLLLLVTAWLLPASQQWSPGRRIALTALLLAAATATWCLVAPLVRPVSSVLSQRNSSAASLYVQGIGEGAAPFRVPVEPGASIEFHASGPPGSEFWICKGVPSPACEGNPYGGVADIEFVNGLEPSVFVHVGVFDAEGKATATWTVQPLADGRLPGVQMIVFDRQQVRTSQTSAAFYFERP